MNASNQEKDFEHIHEHAKAKGFDADVEFASDRYAQIAIQGPKGRDTLQKLTATPTGRDQVLLVCRRRSERFPARIAHTGYTGEDGFEIYVAPADAPRIWNELIAAGEEFGIKPCGLGARNTLRLEAKMALYGHEITATHQSVGSRSGLDCENG